MEDTNSSTVRLLLLDMTSKGLCTTPAPAGVWEAEINEERILSDWSWLFAYEGIRNGWLADKNNVMATPFFKAMISRNVVFYDPRRNIRTSASVKRDRFREIREQNREVAHLLESLRGIDFQIDPGWSEY